MRILFIIALLIFIMMPAQAYDIKQSFVGEGSWSTTTKLGATTIEMAGQGDMAYAAQGSSTSGSQEAIMKAGLEFDGTRGKIRVLSELGPKIKYGSLSTGITHANIRLDFDTLTKEDYPDSLLGMLIQYSAGINGQLNGSTREQISDGTHMGRPIKVSELAGIGNFTLNTTLRLNDYDGGPKT